jgi:UDP:flavonoid glycosyltransferase YjiC (YdhE family)
MGKILCCWELGEGYGHIGQFFPVIKEFVRRGHEVHFVVKDLSKLGNLDWPASVSFLQAPLWLERPKNSLGAECYAEIILHKGYESAVHLKTLVKAWQYLLESVNPDLLILDHAPTALLASRGMQVPRLLFTNPFVAPPASSLPISMRPWQSVNQARLDEVDALVTRTINQVCDELGLPPITRVSDLFVVDRTILTGFYELDLYRDLRSSAIYGGSLPGGDGLQRPAWAPGMSIKVFAYLKAGRENVEAVLQYLAALQVRVVCFYSGARTKDLERYRGSSIIVSDKPFDVMQACRDANVIICHAGMGMVSSALYAGKPMILLPTQVEQQNTAFQLKNLGVATLIQKEDPAPMVEEKLKNFFNSPNLKENALMFAEKIKGTLKGDIVQVLVHDSEDLISHR